MAKGEARVIACLQDKKDDKMMSADCRKEVTADLIFTSKHEGADYALNKACDADKKKFCANVTPGNGATRKCMRDHLKELSPDCYKAEFRRLVLENKDIRLSTSLAESCKDDKIKFCKDVKPGEGRTHKCIKEHYDELSEPCKNAEFAHLKQSSSDIRLKPSLQKACSADIGRFCKDVAKGEARVIACLRKNREDDAMTEECRKEILEEVIMENKHPELNVKLSEACEADVKKFCPAAPQGPKDGTKIHICLRKNYGSLDPKCRQAEFIEIIDEGKDYRIANILSLHCKEDHQKYCAKVKAGNGRIHSCMHDHLQQLTKPCRDASFDDMMIRNMDIRLKPALLAACQEDVRQVCKGTQFGNARVLRCLQDNIASTELSASCREHLAKDLAVASSNIQLRKRMETECKADTGRLCAGKTNEEKQKCLVDNHTKIQAAGCAKEVRRAIRLASLDVRADARAAKACKHDEELYCKINENKGARKDHRCLRMHLDALQPACREVELQRMKLESYSVDFKQDISSNCAVEMKSFCKDVPKEKGKMLKCLQENIYHITMGEACRKELEADFKVTMR